MKEQSLFFQSEGKQLFGVEFIPFEQPNSYKTGFIICSPFAEEKKSSQKILVDIARELCRQNYFVFLFDFCGCGDSSGNFASVTVSHWLKDLRNAHAYFIQKHDLQQINMIGLRFGAFICLLYAETQQNIGTLVLLEPVFNPEKYIHQILRSKIIKELHTIGKTKSIRADLIKSFKNGNNIVDFDGYELSSIFYNNLIKHTCKQFNTLANIKILTISLNQKQSIDFSKYFTATKPEVRHVQLTQFWNKVHIDEYQCLIETLLATLSPL